MARAQSFTKGTVREAIIGSRGVITVVASRLDVNRQTVKNYLARYPELQVLLDEERDTLVDLAESKLYLDVARGNQPAYLFVLKTMGKDRGWTERTEITGKDGQALTLSPDVISILASHHLDIPTLAREIEAMARGLAALPADAAVSLVP